MKKRIFAVTMALMCLVSCMCMPAFADTVMGATSDVRIAGYSNGLSTVSPRPVISNNRFGGVLVHGDIKCDSLSVSDVTWISDDSDCGGYFNVTYHIHFDHVTASDFVTGISEAVCAIPVDAKNAKMEWFVSFVPDDCDYTYPDNQNMIYGMSGLELQKLNSSGESYYVDMDMQSMMSFHWYPTSSDAQIGGIYISVKIWDPDVRIISSIPVGKGFGGWLTYMFDLVSDAVIAFFTTFMNVPLMVPILGITGSALLTSIIIGIVR